MSEAKAESAEVKPKKSFGHLIPFAIIGINLIGSLAGVFFMYKGTLGLPKPAIFEEAAMEALLKEKDAIGIDQPLMYTMPALTVNLDGQPERLIKVAITFEMLDKDGFEEIVRHSPQTRDRVVGILNSKTFNDLESVQGKLFLKDQIIVALNKEMKEGVIKDIYFSEFMVQ